MCMYISNNIYFRLFFQNVIYLKETIEKRKQLLLNYGLNFQPSVAVIGTPSEIDAVYIIINDKTYLFSDLTGAIDVCFKIFHALNAKYLADAEIIWIFI